MTNEFLSQVGIERCISSDHIQQLKQFSKDINNFQKVPLNFEVQMKNYIKETSLFQAKREKWYIVCHVNFLGHTTSASSLKPEPALSEGWT